MQTPLLEHIEDGKTLTVWDPFCGSGVLLLEALGLALRELPGNPSLEYPFMKFPCHDDVRFSSFLQELQQEAPLSLKRVTFLGSDIDPEQTLNAQRNLRRFLRRLPKSDSEVAFLDSKNLDSLDPKADGDEGLDNVNPYHISFDTGHFRKISPNLQGQKTLVVANVPYGHRLRRHDVEAMYEQFGRVLRHRADDWQGVFCLCARDEFKRSTGLEWETMLRFSHGGIWVEWLRWTGLQRRLQDD
eukprot:gnl/MRDRNA2_/MRDRNA2_14699_c0_seq1.p1 gnl/MRDRNA2_/MRDRNA2_14699_c0~~gnl/MRDRNA2_/MRDRNA2_14699_c0_seq1.p1  ORF type:complete len:243 (-),score=35.79 gnl/MRDRNA2_/MRDRNA2_14699_c0_seq1:249-977(-)